MTRRDQPICACGGTGWDDSEPCPNPAHLDALLLEVAEQERRRDVEQAS